jgi:cysteinyl-tRNA synthetase
LKLAPPRLLRPLLLLLQSSRVPLQIFNTLSGQKEPFTPRQAGKVGLYVCGITPYDMCHLGHARTYVTFDVVARYLRVSGYAVDFVKNFTDVDDKIIKKAQAEGVTAEVVAERFIAEYEKDMAALGIGPPDHAPRVTTHIAQVIALVERLVARGIAYPIEGDVYFEVSQFSSYLALSHRSWDDIEAGARVEIDARKRAPADFALWKAAKPGEPSWPSPWGAGRPGWHIECSAMAETYLGETFDIHGGGRDLIFPHHTNEIAQSEGASGQPFAKLWMHAGMLNVDNEKMAKSVGNFFTIRDVLKNVEGEALRAFFLNASYRGPMNISFPAVDEAERRLAYVYKTLHRADQFLLGSTHSADLRGGIHTADLPEAARAIWPQFVEAMDDDFNTAAALSGLSPVLGQLNELLDKPPKPREQTQRTVAAIAGELRRCGAVVGLYQAPPEQMLERRRTRLVAQRGIDVKKVEALIAQRTQARADKRFADADALRVELAGMGIAVRDGLVGTVWEIVEQAPA